MTGPATREARLIELRRRVIKEERRNERVRLARAPSPVAVVPVEIERDDAHIDVPTPDRVRK